MLVNLVMRDSLSSFRRNSVIIGSNYVMLGTSKLRQPTADALHLPFRFFFSSDIGGHVLRIWLGFRLELVEIRVPVRGDFERNWTGL